MHGSASMLTRGTRSLDSWKIPDETSRGTRASAAQFRSLQFVVGLCNVGCE